jgi:hypothetical protein
MAGYFFLVILIMAIAKIADLVFMSKAYEIAKNLGEKPPASGFIFGFVEDYFWQRIFEISDDKQSSLLKKYLFFHRAAIMLFFSGAAALFMMTAIQYSK